MNTGLKINMAKYVYFGWNTRIYGYSNIDTGMLATLFHHEVDVKHKELVNAFAKHLALQCRVYIIQTNTSTTYSLSLILTLLGRMADCHQESVKVTTIGRKLYITYTI